MNTAEPEHRAFGPRIAVIGGGLSGLSLALRLRSMPGFRGRLTLYEARAAYADDRRWSFWSLGTHPFDGVPMRRFAHLRVAAGGRSTSFDCDATPYVCLAAGDVYAHAVSTLAGDPRFALGMGVTVRAIEHDPDGARILFEAEDGEDRDGSGGDQPQAQRFDLVFDARPPRTAPEFLQWFVGGEVALDADARMPEPVLMDFDLGDAAGSKQIVFAYVLPQAEDRVLVQLTWFLPRGAVPPDDAWLRWRRYVEGLGLDPARLLREECGAIPMEVVRPTIDPQARVQPIGAAAGWIRAATGYGFLDTQRAAARLAQALVDAEMSADTGSSARAGRYAYVRARSRIDDAMDAIVLDAMRHAPDAAAGWFLRLFERCSPPRLIRFLSGEATVVDRLAVMAALPPGPFLGAAWRRGRSLLR
jgi:lycopene beta-cyclase